MLGMDRIDTVSRQGDRGGQLVPMRIQSAKRSVVKEYSLQLVRLQQRCRSSYSFLVNLHTEKEFRELRKQNYCEYFVILGP